ncbi:hypothetical protein HYFRA_00006472 [Hymenoscyphus fraxineus]|uniref:Apple domain-containing protein n=1 Tax=Hymenoscyphus fraxineus TaxID=746836 RepID=A0A9N9KNM0_9HELO|nr:hypothetical protein HYFRA_00006472 [Hymenoscyphus fraxineus]
MSNGTWFPSEGTSYTTLYQDLDRIGVGDIGNDGADSIQECLDKCSMFSIDTCGAAILDTMTRKCFYKNSNVTGLGAVFREGYIMGIANRSQIQQLPSICNNNGQTQITQNGLKLSVYCDQNSSGGDLCSNEAPECRAHTNSLEECLEFCSTRHPLCTGVSWDSTVQYGYQNCYPKNATAQNFDKARGSALKTHSAKVLLQAPPPSDCLARSSISSLAKDQGTFTLACDEDRPGNNITVLHADSIDSCVDSCARNSEKNPKCVGAVFDAKMQGGYENCYLKSAFGERLPDQGGFMFALRQDSVPSNISNATNNTTLNTSSPTTNILSGTSTPATDPNSVLGKNTSSRTTVIAPIVGAVLGVAITLAIVCWWRRLRRKRQVGITKNMSEDFQQEQKRVASGLQKEVFSKPELSVEGQKYELDNAPNQFELNGKSRRHELHENRRE